MTLHTLDLSHIITHLDDLHILLRSIIPTVRKLCLEHINLNDYKDFQDLLALLMETQLEACDLHMLNAGNQGLNFGQINRVRPYHGRTFEYGIVLTDAANGSEFILMLIATGFRSTRRIMKTSDSGCKRNLKASNSRRDMDTRHFVGNRK